MPSTRRIKAVGLLVVLIIVVTFYITSGARQTRQSSFYTKTQDALAQQRAAREASLGSKDNSIDTDTNSGAVGKRLREAEEAAKKAADKKAEEFHGGEIVEDKKKEKVAMDKQQAKDAAKKGGSQGAIKSSKSHKQSDEETEEESQVKDELNAILKKSPIIIFSKSYCPFSKKAKDILLNKYDITPAPYIVELDLHDIGPALQAELGSVTGRRTVPNILVNGKSIGGGDDIQSLHEDGKLVDKIKTMVGKRVQISLVEEEEEDGGIAVRAHKGHA